MKRNALIVAGGSGTRMGGGIPKQFRSLNGRPVLWWSMKAFHDENPATTIILVLPQEFISFWEDYYAALPEADRFPCRCVSGGKTRTESVRNGLKALGDDPCLIAVHDGARPMVTPKVISDGWDTALKEGAAIPVIAVTDSLRKVDEGGSHSVDRSEYVAVQTPQVFQSDILIEAYKRAKDGIFTDDASVVESAGHKVALFQGDPMNIKITNPNDMAIAEILIARNA